MKTTSLVLAGLVLSLASTGFAAPKEDVQKVVESFYAQYYKDCLLKPARNDSDKALIQWVAANPAVTDAFKAALRKAFADARKKDPELGMESDPILNAQDYPKKGYHAKGIQVAGDKASVVMEGVGAPDFKVSVDLLSINQQWKINGIGNINRSRK